MHGPPLSPPELVRVLRQRVLWYRARGLDQPAAVLAVAADTGANPEKIMALLGGPLQ